MSHWEEIVEKTRASFKAKLDANWEMDDYDKAAVMADFNNAITELVTEFQIVAEELQADIQEMQKQIGGGRWGS